MAESRYATDGDAVDSDTAEAWKPALDDGRAEYEIAALLGWTAREVVESLGGGWRRHRGEAGDLDLRPVEWFIAGHPAQLMLAIGRDEVGLTVPEGRWQGASELHYVPVDSCLVWMRHDELRDRGAQEVRTMQARRRRALRWCRYCRRLTPPEERAAPDQCYGCASVWDGAVY